MSFLADNPRPVLDFFVRTESVLAGSSDYFSTLKNVSKISVPFFGDWCVVDLYDRIADKIERIAIHHQDPQKAQFAESLERRLPPDRSDSRVGPRHVLRTLEPELIQKVDLRDVIRAVPDAVQVSLMKQLGIESTLCVPMLIRGVPIGVITFVSGTPDRRYGPSDVPIAQQFARVAALYIEISRLEWELSSSLELRDHLLTLMAHDLRNPVAAIQLTAELMQRKKQLTKDSLDSIATRIKSSCRSLSDLINDLASFRKNRMSLVTSRRDQVNPMRIVNRCVSILKDLASSKNVILDASQTETLSNSIESDPVYLQSVFAFVIQNSIFALRSGGMVRLSSEEVNGTLQLMIEVLGEKIDISLFDAGHDAALNMCSVVGCRFGYESTARGIVLRFAFALGPREEKSGQDLKRANF